MSYPPENRGPLPLNYSQPMRNNVRDVAIRQRAVMLCLLIYIAIAGVRIVLMTAIAQATTSANPGAATVALALLFLVVGLAALGIVITTAVMVFRLALTVYGTGAGIVLGILTLIPFLGLIPLLIVNAKATAILRGNGITVGLIGARRDQIPPA